MVTADQPEAPPYFVMTVLNSKERATLEEALERELKPLDLERVLEGREWCTDFGHTASRRNLRGDPSGSTNIDSAGIRHGLGRY